MMRMPGYWPFDYSRYRYFGECKPQFRLPVYTAPFPDGVRLGISKVSGERFNIYEHCWSPNEDYISARTDEGWVNIWTLYNNSGYPRGVPFAQISLTPRPSDGSGDAGAGSGDAGSGDAGDGSGDAGSSGAAGASSSGVAIGDGSSAKRTPAGRRRRGPYQ